jgi:ribosomal protein S18 acetylase RimI-like enzyme
VSAPGGETRIGCRPYQPADRDGVSAILHRTGFLGEDLDGTWLFDDRTLFRLVNVEGYLRFQASNAFVAVDETDGSIVGYIIGTADSHAYERLFKRRMYWRIAARAFLVSWWRHPESFRQILSWAFTYSEPATPFFDEYPAHLHINVLPDYQRYGIGGRLIGLFVARMTELGVTGIHLGTSNRNAKALPFYAKHGFTVLVEKPGIFWRGVEGHVSVILGKRIGGK